MIIDQTTFHEITTSLYVRYYVLIAVLFITLLVYCVWLRQNKLVFYIGVVAWMDLIIQAIGLLTFLIVAADKNTETMIKTLFSVQNIGEFLEFLFYVAILAVFIIVCNKLSRETNKYMFWQTPKNKNN